MAPEGLVSTKRGTQYYKRKDTQAAYDRLAYVAMRPDVYDQVWDDLRPGIITPDHAPLIRPDREPGPETDPLRGFRWLDGPFMGKREDITIWDDIYEGREAFEETYFLETEEIVIEPLPWRKGCSTRVFQFQRGDDSGPLYRLEWWDDETEQECTSPPMARWKAERIQAGLLDDLGVDAEIVED